MKVYSLEWVIDFWGKKKEILEKSGENVGKND
jgi:hypothetical protein